MSNLTNEYCILRCLELARRGAGSVSPNPLVGAVIVVDGNIVAEGYHKKFGGPHAEIEALNALSDHALLKRATLYVNLEPCVHYGKTPPCVKAIIEAGIPAVVLGVLDPNPLVAGKGVAALRDAGVNVITDKCAEECREVNRRFFTAIEKKRPYIILKWAETADGFIARLDGSSKWISSELSRRLVHKWRSREDAVIVGTRTARIDNPALTVRHIEGRDPVRVVLDKNLTLPSTLKLFDGSARTYVFSEVRDQFHRLNCELVNIKFDEDTVQNVVQELYIRGFASVMVEGGATLLQSFIEAELWDETRVFRSKTAFKEGLPAPKLKQKASFAREIDEDKLEFYFLDNSLTGLTVADELEHDFLSRNNDVR